MSPQQGEGRSSIRASEPSTIFDDETSRPIEVDFRGTVERCPRAHPGGAPARQPVDPKAAARTGPAEAWRRRARGDAAAAPLGMARTPAGRRLGGAAQAGRRGPARHMRAATASARRRRPRNRFMMAMAGDCRGYEEASRALFAGDKPRFEARDRSLAGGHPRPRRQAGRPRLRALMGEQIMADHRFAGRLRSGKPSSSSSGR